MSFPPGTMIALADGAEVPIEEMIPGRVVVTEKGELGEVIAVHSRYSVAGLSLIRINYQDAGVLHATDDHKILTDRGFLPSGRLVVGDRLGTPILRDEWEATGHVWWEVMDVRREPYDGPLYDLEVVASHSYVANNIAVSDGMVAS